MMNTKIFKPITETKYLSVENAWRYRGIMRSFYIYDQKYKHWIYKEDIFQDLQKIQNFETYTIELCKQDLDMLVSWGNLSAIQDTTKVATYQQFMNKQFRYQMTEYAIEIERMAIRLENLFIEGSSLEPTLLERIKDELKTLSKMPELEDKEVGAWWSQLSADFQRLNQNYQDYIRDWYSAKAEELMKTKIFLMYKEKLVEYLRNFIKELQQYAHEIEYILKQVSKEKNTEIIEKICRYEQSIPRMDIEEVSFEALKENIEGKYSSLLNFFLSINGNESEVEKILSMTNEIIRRITRYAANILEMSNQYSNRREEYKKMMDLFGECDDIKEAHLLSSQVFGISTYKHFQGEMTRETESINSSIFDEKALQKITPPRIRNYREKVVKTAIKDHSVEKKEMRAQVLEKREAERVLLEYYIKTGRIDFKTLKNIKPSVRKTFLRWLAKGISEQGQIAVNEFGHKFRLINPKENNRCILTCEDGNLEMPAYILEFEVHT